MLMTKTKIISDNEYKDHLTILNPMELNPMESNPMESNPIESNPMESNPLFISTVNSAINQFPDINSVEFDDDKKTQDAIVVETGDQKGINWDQANITTLNNWIIECNKQQFIYEDALETILLKSKYIKIFMLILCTIQSAISISNLGIDDNQDIYLVWTFKIILIITSALTYILTQVMALEKYDDNIKSYTSYIESLNILLSDLTTTSDIKFELRPDGDKFILDYKDIFTNIYRKSPYIGQTEWKAAINEYSSYLKNLDSGMDDYRGRKRHTYTRYVVDSGNYSLACGDSSPRKVRSIQKYGNIR
jgi:hypothetical protein